MSHKLTIIDGRPALSANGKSAAPRPELAAYFQSTQRSAKLSIDAARSGTELDNHWAFADALDADSAYDKKTRHTLIHRSRYEATNNAFYAGILKSYSDLLIGTGPNLRMLTGNRIFNQLVEREFYRWAQEIQLRHKLWTMCHAKIQDGESFGILQFNPNVRGPVKLDLLLVEAEQCQSYYDSAASRNADGIIYDNFDNIIAYEFLPNHPGGSFISFDKPIPVSAADVIHWFKKQRPGQHRGIPELTPSMKVSAYSRRMREAVTGAAEYAASINAMLVALMGPNAEGSPDPIRAGTTIEMAMRQLVSAPYGWDVKQLKGEHPNAQYGEFCRLQAGEQGRPISMPVNATTVDSSDYSFASGKLDMLLFWRGADVDRKDCDDCVLDDIFAAWFREWTIIAERRDIPPAHQWDWPVHPVIDAVADETAKSKALENGTLTMRQANSDAGKDYEDQLVIQAEDTFGEATEESIAKCRRINVLKNTPQHAIQYVAAEMGITAPIAPPPNTEPIDENAQAV